ncbi:MAG TPA: hypothetical protein VI454_12085, partial [Verrucomicrobiae bacterium]
AGAVEALKANWCPVFVREGDNVPKGNRELQKLGAVLLTETQLTETSDLSAWMREHAARPVVEQDLFNR